jgi:hypothetical protein
MSSHTPSTAGLGDRTSLVSELVNTYRELNMHVRQLPEDRLSAGGEQSVRAIVSRMRRDEMLFAQALKERVTGVVLGKAGGEDGPVLGSESEDDTTAMIISQFGTARATTLNLVKDLTDDDWNAVTDDGKSILDHVRDLVASDQTQLQRIKTTLA